MPITTDVVVLNQPYGNPGSLGEPLGIWSGRATIVGDASGGDIQLRFQPQNPALTPTLDDQRLQYVWFVDGANITANGTPGALGCKIVAHWARSNAAISPAGEVQWADLSRFDGLHFTSIRTLVPPGWERMPIFWDTQELTVGNSTIVHLQAETNTNTVTYNFAAYGRYYDKQILSNRGFGRLISPPAVSQFEG